MALSSPFASLPCCCRSAKVWLMRTIESNGTFNSLAIPEMS